MTSSVQLGVLGRSILGVTPFESPDGALCVALSRAGGLGILDLGREMRSAKAALAAVAAQVPGEYGVRIPEGVDLEATSLPESVALVLTGPEAVARYATRFPVLAQVISLDEARIARRAGAAGLIAKGSESGGRIGEETSFVLLQRLLAADLGLPIWLQGGVGVHTSAAAIVAGARGVVIDAQLALVRESAVPEPIKAMLTAMDGSETTVLAGHRVFTRPDLPVAKLTHLSREELLSRLGGRDLQAQVLPAGQDGGLASPMAKRFRTAGGVVRGLTRAIDRHLRQAREHLPLAEGSALASDLGIRFPIAQGPMTRVSDRAAFAAAVAQGGAMPFLALSLLRRDEVQRLLEETKAQLGERPFGVGILGFVPKELRDEQLQVVEEFRPKAALIAGGRPDQARSLQEKGIDTFLHVPSPALLDLFLQDGARRFVFEGRECGGHVGPRSSFVLWEQAMERLLSHPAPEELSVLFAGGIHDARSAAMVAALAAPLVDQGAHVGVLMGTAYLFTEEAVSSGAITRTFQEEALRCEHTALLETAPGHATRCVETDYVRAFRARRSELEAMGLGPSKVWEELEQLNLGRLRIAAKGLVREGERLVPVDAETQRRDGMYMIGQVAAARSTVVSIEELHREVCAGSSAWLERLELPEPVSPADVHRIDVAIVGMASLFPDAPDLKSFWANVLGGVDSVREVPADRWNAELYFDSSSTNGEKTPCKWGGFLPDVPFDPLSFGLPPRSLSSIDPVQLLSLEVARRALADAGYLEREFDRERTSVIFGTESGTDLSAAYTFRALYPQLLGPMPEELAEHLPTLSEDSFAGVLGNVIAGRIANRLDLGGVNYTVDAACASSLAALDLAVKELVTGSSEMVLCGGADLHNGINDYLMFASVHALSRRGRCRTFDADADGIVLGEGVACLVLKRLADAERDGDRIYAVVRGVGGSSDGRSLGLTAPRKEGQVRAIERAYRQAAVSPSEVGLVEAHGTGTVVGDRTELASLTEVFARAGATAGSTTLGSVKSQIGHTKCTAGLAGLIKAALSLYHRVLPPTLHVSTPNSGYEMATSPFVLSGASRPWLTPEGGKTRKAAVSAFGFGGTNFHAVLAEYPRAEPPAAGGLRFPGELFLLRGNSTEQAAIRARSYLERLERPVPGTLADLAFTWNSSGEGAVQIALVAKDHDDLKRKLARAQTVSAGDGVFVADASKPHGQVAFLFPGQGSQRVGMLSELFLAFPSLQRLLELGRRWSGSMLPAPGFKEEDRAAQAATLTDTRVAQPALGVASLAALELLSSLGIAPDLVGGHSYGELAALCAAGALSQADLLSLSEARARCTLEAIKGEPGVMAAVSGPLAEIKELCEGTGATVVNENGPVQAVIAGTKAAVDAALAKLERHGLSAQRLQVACAFHSPLLAGADQLFAEKLAHIEWRSPALPVFSNLTAARYPENPAEVREVLARQLVSPVRFAEQIEAMYSAGARIFVEAGPGQVLTRLTGRILGERPHLAVAIAPDGKTALGSLLEALAQLAVSGVPVQIAPLFAGRQVRRLDLDLPVPKESPSLWMVNGHLARPASGELPKGSLRPNEAPLVVHTPLAAIETGGSVGASAEANRETTVLSFLQGMQQLADAQREVMLRYLGAPAEPSRETKRAPSPIRKVNGVRTEGDPSGANRSGANGAVHAAHKSESERSHSEANGAQSIDVTRVLLTLVSERTGYPAEMLGLDADLEAELSIDSIKRVEILGVLSHKLGLASNGSTAGLEELAAIKTLRGIASWLEKRLAPGASPSQPLSEPRAPTNGHARSVEVAPSVAPKLPSAPTLHWARTELVESALLPSSQPTSLAGRRYWLVPDREGEVAKALAAKLSQAGALPCLQNERPTGVLHGLIDLSGLFTGREGLWPMLVRCREALGLGATEILAASGLGGRAGRDASLPTGGELRGAGVSGMLKSLARERVGLDVHVVDLEPSEPAEQSARALLAELIGHDKTIESAWRDGVRRVIEVRAVREEMPRINVALDANSVVLLTGGARGITAELAIALARRFHCTLELVGRRELPAQEDPSVAAASDLPAIRKDLLGRGGHNGLAEIEAEAQRIWAAREARRTLAAIVEAGGRANYQAVDVRSASAVEKLIASLYQRHSRIDAVFHGAGVLDDRNLEDKQQAGFDKVVETKLGGAGALTRSLRPDLKLLAFFGSVSGVFGNRGQFDYAAANDALDRLAWALRGHFAGPVVSLDFGPWAGAGMVTPELAREYERRQVPLVPLGAGIESLLSVLFDRTAPEASRLPSQMLLTASPLDVFAASAVSASPVATAASAAPAAYEARSS
jgi:acyl transferase domain-containing protein/NAD(P)H-dependent flavin oxidoreductase YrpB (nitropropane dioxygenase family)/NAD(P)-dependent dehydrogenase (short-subunit alcohol dehydrogenase family)